MTAQDVSLASTSTAPTGKPPLTKDPAERPHGRLEKHKMVHVRPSEKNNGAVLGRCGVCQYINEEKKPVLYVRLEV